MMIDWNGRELQDQIRRWLDEDIGFGDVTTMATIDDGHRSKGIIHMKESGVIAGIPAAAAVFASVDSSLTVRLLARDGDQVQRGAVVMEVEGSTRSILMGERLALNLMQRMSGIATKTRSLVQRIADLPVRLADTRKTTPGHRALEKYAVTVGGGSNHRFGLFDAVMIKDNHIKGAGGVGPAIHAARRRIPHTMKIEVEVESFGQLEEAVEAGADIIMLDNMSPAAMTEAVRYVKDRRPHVTVEASGGVHAGNLREIALTGVDVISMGSLTYSVQALDISLDLNERKGSSQ